MATLLGVVATVTPAAGTTAAGATGPGHYQEFGDAGGFLNVLPGGEQGARNAVDTLFSILGLAPRAPTDQHTMYESLVRAVPGLSEDELDRYFKPAAFGVATSDVGRVYDPMPGVTVVRDKGFGVAHIFGQTREATMFAQGYTGAEDRLFVMDVLRHVGRSRLSELLGPSAANQAMDRAQLTAAPYTDADFSQQVDVLAAGGREGAAVVADLEAYARGVNAYIGQALLDPLKLPAEYAAIQQLPEPWSPEDTVAVSSFIGAQLGRGGGRELANYCGLTAMASELGDAATARAVFDDLHFTDDPEAPTTSDRPAPYPAGLGPVDQAAVPEVDCASLTPVGSHLPSLADVLRAISGALPVGAITAPFGSLNLAMPRGLSNAVLVGGEQTRSGDPIAVFGPQVGYFAPQVLVEKDVHGPGIDARGIAFAGTDLYVQMGRGRNFAWSATSSGADNVDQVILRLCDPAGGPVTPESRGALRDGRCEPIASHQHVQLAKPTLAGLPESADLVLSWPVERSTILGPVVARGRLLDGTPIAVATRRSTYGAELSSALGFRRLNDPAAMEDGFASFRHAVSGIDYTFNWFYVDAHDIGYQQSCRCPRRASGIDPNLPTWGTGRWDWTGFIGPGEQPWDLNPARGYLTSWNNRQAPGFAAADDTFGWGPVHRSQLLDSRIEAAISTGPVDRAAVVSAAQDAATADLRGERVLSLLLDVLGSAPPPGVDARAGELRKRLADWAASGAHRRDRDADGAYDDAVGPAVMDAWWERAVRAIFDEVSGHAVDHLEIPVHDAPQHHVGSAFQSGVYSHMHKDLRQVLGRLVTGRWSRSYCGRGDLTACRASLWEALSAAAASLEQEFGSPRVADWRRVPTDDEIRFSTIGLDGEASMAWVNRPTFQQVVQLRA